MKVSDNPGQARTTRVSYRRGDIISVLVGGLLTLYALVWFTHRTIQGLNRDRAVVPAALRSHTDLASGEESGMSHGGPPAESSDYQFLREMSDHYEGLIRMATSAMGQASVAETQGDAHMLHEMHAVVRDSMLALIQRDYHQLHHAQPMPKHQAQADSLAALTGRDYDRAFYRMTIEHHREGLAMADRRLPTLTQPETRRMAETMRADQQKEITALERKLRSR